MDLQAQVLRVDAHLQRIALPESEEWIGKSEPIKEWNAKHRGRIAMAMSDGNEALLQEALGALVKGQERVNRLIAEDLRARHPSPDAWPLEYFKWMAVKYLHFTCPLGDFLLFPQTPRVVPRIMGVVTWLTAEEMIQINSSPAIVETIRLFGVLPSRPEVVAMNLPPREENDLHINYTTDPPTVKALRGNLVNRRRWQ